MNKREADKKIDELRDILVRDPNTGIPRGFDLTHYGNRAFHFAMINDPSFAARVGGEYNLKDEDALHAFRFSRGRDNELHTRLGLEWLNKAENKSPKLVSDLRKIVLDTFLNGYADNFYPEIENQRPPYEIMNLAGDVSNQWVVHATPEVDEISQRGFIYGSPTVFGMGLTRGKIKGFFGDEQIPQHIRELKKPGYNFGFRPKDITERIIQKYSKGRPSLVIFPLDRGIEVYHKGDGENQVIFWGPAVNPADIISLGMFGKHGTTKESRWYATQSREKPIGENQGNLREAIERVTQNPEFYRSLLDKARAA